MRSIALFLELVLLLPIVLVRPFIGVVLWSWISFMNPHRLVFGGIALAIPWATIIFCATVIGCCVAREPRRLPINAITVLIGGFLLMISITTPFALAPSDDVATKYTTVFKIFLFLLVTASLLTSRERIHALIWVMAISLAYFGIKGGGFTLIGGGANRVFGPSSSMIFDNNHLATALLVALPLMNYLRIESRHAIIRCGWIATMGLTLFAVVGSYSRGALVALVAMSGYFWLKSSSKLLSGTLVILALAIAFAFMPAMWIERMHSIASYQQDRSAESRLEVWHTAWVMATTRPLVGAGFYATYNQDVVDTFVTDGHTRAVHSIWLEVLAENGFPTFFIWVGITVAAAIYARRIIRRAQGIPELAWCVNLARMSQVSMIAYLSGGSFLSLSYWDYYFTILVSVGATYRHVQEALRQDSGYRPLAINAMPARLALSQSRVHA